MSDYKGALFPKPTFKKKKKKVNGWKDKHKRFCKYCGAPYAERHEVFCGPNRQNSINFGFQVDVCPAHHKWLQDNIEPDAQAENQRLKEDFERKYIEELTEEGISQEDALTAWMLLIGRNYCDELQPK